ncbi:MAG: PEP-CTERM sorting domain-containing protein [Verrucomicrobiaceae bacterium]|nr:MAG: PEP-CTERM sorting domain-containing protein [Verrucomicrobiaceae bacterium]
MKHTLTLTAAALLSQIAGANAAILLIIDVSNPAQVKVTATNAASYASTSMKLPSDGFTLQNVLQAAGTITSHDVVSDMITASNLFPTQSPALNGGIASRYNALGTFNYESGTGDFGAGNDLSFFQNNGGNTDNSQIFIAGQRAFNGESVWDFSAYPGLIPAAGTTGNVISGYLPLASGGGHGVILGEFTVIPEPSSLALGALAASALVLRRRRI